METTMSLSRCTKFKEKTFNETPSASSCAAQQKYFVKPDIGCQKAASAMKQFYSKSKLTLKKLNISFGELSGTLTGNGIKICEFNEELKEALVQLDSCENVIDVMGYLVKSFDTTILPSKKLLCISQLPAHYDDKELHELMLKYGEPIMCFMYRCSNSDDKLGYGFAEFSGSIEKSKQIQQKLDWLELEKNYLHCDFIESASYEKLCSKCLMIDNLPKDFNDVMALRDIFSCCHKPLYCQIVMNNGESLGYGIIEYHTQLEAKRSKDKLDNHVINGEPIRLTFCIPGKPGFCLCSRIQSKFNSDGNKTSSVPVKGGLLPDPVFLQEELMKTPLAKKLCEQCPDLVTCFKQSLNQFQQTYTGQMTASSKPGLLGPAPSDQMNPLLNPNMQLGLLVVLALQLQTRTQNRMLSPPDLFGLVLNGQSFQAATIPGDPLAVQASVILKNLTNQLSASSNRLTNQQRRHNFNQSSSLLQTLTSSVKNINMNMLISLGQLASSIQKLSGKGLLGSGPQPLMKRIPTQQKPKSLLDLPVGVGQQLQNKPTSGNQKPVGGQQLHNIPASGNQKPKSLLELDLSEYERKFTGNTGQDRVYNSAIKENIPANELPHRSSPVYTVPASVNEIEGTGSSTNYWNNTNQHDHYSNVKNNNGCYHGLSGSSQHVHVPKVDKNLQRSYPQNSTYNRHDSMDEPDGLMPPPPCLLSQIPPTTATTDGKDFQRQTSSSVDHSTNLPLIPPLMSLSGIKTQYMEDIFVSKRCRSQTSSTSDYSDSFTDPSSLCEPSFRSNDSLFSDGGYSNSGYSTPASVKEENVYRTPIGQKRSYSHLLPPPEPSPEGDFIGQHSQGIGGHYAESYKKRPRLDSSDFFSHF